MAVKLEICFVNICTFKSRYIFSKNGVTVDKKQKVLILTLLVFRSD